MAKFLNDIKVLEISARSTMLAGRILGDLGADVITIEPPGGSPGRRIEPFVSQIPGLERSLTWQALNYNKRGITLDVKKSDGLQILQELINQCDIVLEEKTSENLSMLDRLEIPGKVIHSLIRPFSKSGPKSTYKSTDLILMAAGGAPSLAGDSDRAPLFFPIPQAMLEAGAEAAVATLSALMARNQDNLGQTVELSSRIASMAGSMGRIVWGFSGDTLPTRMPPGGATTGGATGLTAAMFECIDGYVVISLIFTNAFLGMTTNLIRWAIAQGAVSAKYENFDWRLYAPTSPTSSPPTEPLNELIAGLNDLCRAKRMTELVDASAKYGFMAAPLMTMKDISAFRHYEERGLFAETTSIPDNKPIKVPARFVQFNDDSIEIRCPAPKLSEHTSSILQVQLGYSLAEIQSLYVHEVI